TFNATGTPTTNTVFSPAQRSGNFGADYQALRNGPGNTTPRPIVGDDGVLHPAGTPWFGGSGAIFNCPGTANTPTCATNPNFGNIGTGSFNSISKNLMNTFVPLPNGSANRFSFNAFNTAKTHQGIARVDHNLTSSDLLWGVAIFQQNDSTQG